MMESFSGSETENRTYREEIAALIMSDVKKDLHIHTCYSDGDMTPQQVVDRWKAEGYELISITDHDGIEGSVIGIDYAADKDIKIIPGIEFDSEDEIGKDLHILGYGYDRECPEFEDALQVMIRKRAERNNKLWNALNNMGYGITIDDINSINEGRYVGKPTFARILANKEVVDTQQEAFLTIFREPEIRCIRKETYQSKFVIDVIHQAGGIAILAHPMEQRHLDESFEEFRPRLFALLEKMIGYGIDGIECYHPSASEEQSKLLREFAESRGLLISKGSDFHSDKHTRDFSRYNRP